MPVNGFNVGRDVSLDIIDANGPVRFGLITKFDAKQVQTDEKIKGLDGIVRHLTTPEGWSGSFDIERQGSDLDKYFNKIESDFYAGKNSLPCQICETVSDPDGGLSTFVYLGVILKFDDAGSWAGTQSVKQKVSFSASRRITA